MPKQQHFIVVTQNNADTSTPYPFPGLSSYFTVTPLPVMYRNSFMNIWEITAPNNVRHLQFIQYLFDTFNVIQVKRLHVECRGNK